jgi:hypothetical protein
MANVLDDDKKQQVLPLGRLGWSLRKIEASTGVRRETASGYLRAAGVAIRAPRQVGPPSKTGHNRWGVHRLGSGKTGQFGGGVHRL